ncbi:hypothetical protein BG015_005144 [Linnemannia schmuckeri]|uniref:Uncharacterized protein n=1 Tax=Linnemannia schmuckeri TaxID=64567 RepID=A0A9P5VCK3_9FUNG|nr:hypothetical protein BG015_005144 [Linnemannia schmuckeri]
MAALASNRDEGTLGPLGEHQSTEDSRELNSNHTPEHAASSSDTLQTKRKAHFQDHHPRTQPPTKRQTRAIHASNSSSTAQAQTPIAPAQAQSATVAAMQAYALATASRSYASQPATHTHIAPAPIAPAPAPASSAPQAIARATSPPSPPVPKPIAVAPKPSAVSTAPTSIPISQPTSTSPTTVLSAQKPRTVTTNKSLTRQLQEEDDDDDEDDDEDDDDEVDDSHLVPSERHLHSFIGHWQGWCRGRRYKDKDYITPQKVLAYVKSMISPGFQLDRLNPPLHVPALNGETEKYLPSWTTVHMNILSIQVLYMRQCERDKSTPDANVMNHPKLKSLLYDYRKRSVVQDPTSKYILDPRLFQPRVEGSISYSSSLPQQPGNVTATSLSPSPPIDNNNSGQSNGKIGIANGNTSSNGHSGGGNGTLGHLTHIPNAHGPYNPPDANPQYCMHTALATMEMEMFMSSLRNDVMAAINQSVEYSRASQTAIEALGGRIDNMELSARKSMMDIADTGLSDVELRDLELYYRRRATQLRQSRLDRKKGQSTAGMSTSTQKKTDRQLREEREKRQEMHPHPHPYSSHSRRSQSAEFFHPDGHSDGDDDNDGEEDQFYDMLPDDEISGHNYAYHSDADLEGGDGYESDLKPTAGKLTRVKTERTKVEKTITLNEDDYDLLPRKNATRKSFAAGTKNTSAQPKCDLFTTKELNLLADDIAGHYNQIEEKKTEENFREDDLLPRNAGLVQLWTEMFSASEKQPSLWGMNVYANGWHLKLEMKVKQRVALKKKIIASVLAKIQAEMEYVASARIPASKAPSLKEMVKSALIAVELEIKRDGSINAYHDRIKRRGNQE